MPEITEWTGSVRGQITSYNWRPPVEDAFTEGVELVFAIEEYWDANLKDWVDVRAKELTVGGTIWLIGKDGKLNQSKAESLMEHAGWDGSMGAFFQGADQPWKPTPCACTVEENSYKRISKWRIGFINSYSGLQNRREPVPEDVARLQTQYGSQLRALAGNVSRNATPPAEGKPPVPTPPAEIPPAKPLAEEIKDVQVVGPSDESDIPF